MTFLNAKEISWPKDVGGGPVVTKLKGGLDEAQPVVQVPPFMKGSLVKPSSFQVKSGAQTSWVIGECSNGVRCGDFESLESVAVPELVLSASALNSDPTHSASEASPAGRLVGATSDVAVSATVALGYELEFDGCKPIFDSSAPGAEVASPFAILERANPDVEFSATVASVSELELDGCTPMEDSGAPGADMVDSDAGKVGSTPASMAMVPPTMQNGSQAHRRRRWVKQNRYSPLFELGNELGTEFGEGEDWVEAFSDYHEVVAQPRSVTSVGICHNDFGLLFLPWDNNGADNCGGGSGGKIIVFWSVIL